MLAKCRRTPDDLGIGNGCVGYRARGKNEIAATARDASAGANIGIGAAIDHAGIHYRVVEHDTVGSVNAAAIGILTAVMDMTMRAREFADGQRAIARMLEHAIVIRAVDRE